MQKIKVLLIEEQQTDIDQFTHVVSHFPNLEYITSFVNAENCYEYVLNNAGDYLIFMDIDLPGKDGLWLAKALETNNSGIIFLTNRPSYANAAFNAAALGFMIKPISVSTLSNTLEIIHKKKQIIDSFFTAKPMPAKGLTVTKRTVPERLLVPMADSLRMVKLEDVLYILSKGSYSEFILQDNKRIVTTKTILVYEKQLEHHPDFVRIHKSYIINKNHLVLISKKWRSHKAVMSNNDELEMSYQRREEILELIIQ